MKLGALLIAVGLTFGLWHQFRAARAFRHATAGGGLRVFDEYEAAAEQFDKALEFNDRPTLYTTVALKPYLRVGRPERALEAISALIKRYPEDTGFLLRRARIYAQLQAGETLRAHLDNRRPDAEKIKLWDQLQQADLRKAAALGADLPRQEPLKRTQIDPELYGTWRVVAVNDQPATGGDVYRFKRRTMSIGNGPDTEYEIDNTKDPKRFTVSMKRIQSWTTYSYRVEGDTLLLAWRVGFMDPPSDFGTRGMATVLKLKRVRD